VSASRDGERRDLEAWIDTPFNGGLTMPRKQLAGRGQLKQSSAEANLADGGSVALEIYAGFLDWFGNTYRSPPATGSIRCLEPSYWPTDA
jgi:predicted aspartyl protease